MGSPVYKKENLPPVTNFPVLPEKIMNGKVLQPAQSEELEQSLAATNQIEVAKLIFKDDDL
jgi:hypothetical protein